MRRQIKGLVNYVQILKGDFQSLRKNIEHLENENRRNMANFMSLMEDYEFCMREQLRKNCALREENEQMMKKVEFAEIIESKIKEVANA